MMAKALKEEGIELAHIIGAKAGHHTRPRPGPRSIGGSTDRRGRPRSDARRGPLHHLDAALQPIDWVESTAWSSTGSGPASTPNCRQSNRRGGPKIKTKNVSALTLAIPPGYCPLDIRDEAAR